MLLSDVTAEDAPTKLVPLKFSRELPLPTRGLPFGELFDREVAATAPAGSLLIYKTDVFHRGSDFTGVHRSRFMMLVDFQQRGWRWQGKMSWPDRANSPGMCEAMVRMTPRERDLFGWPPPGSEYWNEQTIADVAARYPRFGHDAVSQAIRGLIARNLAAGRAFSASRETQRAASASITSVQPSTTKSIPMNRPITHKPESGHEAAIEIPSISEIAPLKMSHPR